MGVGALKLTGYLREQMQQRNLHLDSLYTVRSLKEVLISDEQRSKYIYIYIYIYIYMWLCVDINNGSSLGLRTCMEANKLRLVLIYAKLMQNLSCCCSKIGSKNG